MKKYLIILILFCCSKSYAQTDTMPDYKGVLKYYTNYVLPNTPVKYWTAYGTFGSFLDTARTAFSLTTTGTSGASTYNSSTGVWNIPQYTSTPGGSDTYVQFNNSGAFGGDSAFRYKLTGMQVLTDTKTYAGVILKPIVAAVTNNDTTVGIDLRPSNSFGIFTGIVNMPIRIRNPSKYNILQIFDSTKMVFGNQIPATLALGGNFQVDTFGVGLYKSGGNYVTMKVANGLFQMNGQNTGFDYLEGGVSQFRVDAAGITTVKTSLTTPILIASANSGTNINAYGTSGGGTSTFPNTVTIGDLGKITSGNGTYSLKLWSYSAGYQDRWTLFNTGSFQNTGTEVASAAFNVESTTKGALVPRMTKAQRDAISSPADGLLVFVTDGTGYLSWYHSGWFKVTSASDP